ncbi:MAG: hypothetical protein J6Z34_03255 [Clostridia bacterium]|nr:hypothetical protein [Clostridia bacterium]
MGKLLKKVALMCVLALIFSLVAACEPVSVNDEKTVTVTVVAGEFEQSFEAKGEIAVVVDALDILNEKDDGFNYTYEATQYGRMIKSICGYAEDAANWKYWMVYTDDMRVIDTLLGEDVYNVYFNEETGEPYSYVYNGKTYYSTGLGVDGQTVIDGENFLFVLG